MKDLNGSGVEAENKTSAQEYISQNPGLQSSEDLLLYVWSWVMYTFFVP